MNDEEFEFTLLDRVAKIKSLNEQYDMSKAYVSFSGGKDSTVLSALIDIALPNNKIKRIYKDTGIEYPQIREFVKNKVLNDERYIYIKPSKNIQKTLKKVGYPFKSKQHSHNFQIYKNNIESCEKYKKEIIESGLAERVYNGTSTEEDVDYIYNLPKGTKTFVKYYFGIRTKEKELPREMPGSVLRERGIFTSMKNVPDSLRYQFEPEYAKTHNWSDKCCAEFKHGELAKFERENDYDYTFTGMRKEEGGNREKLNCISKGSNSLHFNVLVPITDEWEEEFIKRYKIELCELYLPPYNFKRTGCAFCPFSQDLQNQIDKMEEINPKLVKQANVLWKTTYDEYRRVGYRLRKHTYNLFDLLEEEKK